MFAGEMVHGAKFAAGGQPPSAVIRASRSPKMGINLFKRPLLAAL
jgi:hypothetical protein